MPSKPSLGKEFVDRAFVLFTKLEVKNKINKIPCVRHKFSEGNVESLKKSSGTTYSLIVRKALMMLILWVIILSALLEASSRASYVKKKKKNP